MSGGKASVKQAAQHTSEQAGEGSVVTCRDTAAAEGEAHSPGHTHSKSMRLKETSVAKKSWGKGEAEKGKQTAAQKKGTRTTSQAPRMQPLLLAADAPFAAALEAIPAEDWCRTWAAGRTIMLGRTSKRVKEVVDKMRLPAVVRLSRSFWDDDRHGTGPCRVLYTVERPAEKLKFVMRQLTVFSARCCISTLELPHCEMKGQDAERPAEVLVQCTALVHLDLSGNYNFGAAGAERFAGVLGQCRELVQLNLRGNQIGDAGAESLAGVLAQCRALVHLDLGYNYIGAARAESFAGVLAQCPALTHLSDNAIDAAGAESLAEVLAQCPGLAHLNLCGNGIRAAGAESLAGVLAKCPGLAHLDLEGNDLEAAGAESLAGVLGQCPVLAHLNLCGNGIRDEGAASLAGVLAQCRELAHLNLRYNQIFDAGVESLAGVLGQCRDLV